MHCLFAGQKDNIGIDQCSHWSMYSPPGCTILIRSPSSQNRKAPDRVLFCFGLKGIESESYSPVGCTSTSANTGRYLYCLFALQKDNARIILRVHHLGKSGNWLPFLTVFARSSRIDNNVNEFSFSYLQKLFPTTQKSRAARLFCV